MIDGQTIAEDFAMGLVAADAREPVYQQWDPGIGPFTERKTISLVLSELEAVRPDRYATARREVQYPESADRCDIGLGEGLDWALEVKVARLIGANGDRSERTPKQLLSPYQHHHSAYGDLLKLIDAPGIATRRGLLVIGYDFDPPCRFEPILKAFERLIADLPVRRTGAARFSGLVHPFQNRGSVYVWEITD